MRAISPRQNYCVGYGDSGVEGDGYYLGLTLGVGKAERILATVEAGMIDEINAFDRAEMDDIYIGQINMITVSSFCGPQGKIWGLDVARAEDLRESKLMSLGEVSVYSAKPLLRAMRKLFGTVDERKFSLLPGSHVPCAKKSIAKEGPVEIYAAVGMGVPEDRENSAVLMMEDVGVIPEEVNDIDKYKNIVLEKIAKSVLEIGKNQRVKYKEIFVSIKSIRIDEGEVGCALVAAPYFAIAKNALPKNDESVLGKITLGKWEKIIYN